MSLAFTRSSSRAPGGPDSITVPRIRLRWPADHGSDRRYGRAAWRRTSPRSTRARPRRGASSSTATAQVAAVAQREHRQLFPRPGWVEHDADEIWANVRGGGRRGDRRLPDDRRRIGITNQRETTWSGTGPPARPVHNAIVWQDTRTEPILRTLADRADEIRRITGLPLATYFAGPKLRWLLDNVDGLRERAERGEVLFGTDRQLAHLEPDRPARHRRDQRQPHAADGPAHPRLGRPDLLDALGVPAAMLPEIRAVVRGLRRSARRPAGRRAGGRRARRPAGGAVRPDLLPARRGQVHLRHRQLPAGQHRRHPGGRRGTACSPRSATRSGRRPPAYALEGAIAVTGALVQWLRDNLGLIGSADEIEELAASVDDNGGCYIVPAFSGLFAPHWRSDARGVIAGLTGYITKAHLARAALEATRLADPRGGRRDGRGHRRGAAPAAGRRRDDRQRPAHAVPRRRAGRAGRAAAGHRDHLPGRGLRGRAGGRLLAGSRRPARPLAAGRRSGSRRWTQARREQRVRPSGARRSSRTLDWV